MQPFWARVLTTAMRILVFFCFSLFLIMMVAQAQELQASAETLPRKLRVLEKAATVKKNGYIKHASSLNNHLKASSSGTTGKQDLYKEAGGVLHHGRDGTRQEWAERTDASEYFTMDYSHVKRRRPIHNNSVPVDP